MNLNSVQNISPNFRRSQTQIIKRELSFAKFYADSGILLHTHLLFLPPLLSTQFT
jgi:hypothetical protein